MGAPPPPKKVQNWLYGKTYKLLLCELPQKDGDVLADRIDNDGWFVNWQWWVIFADILSDFFIDLQGLYTRNICLW